jgi:1,4-dihydroxy-2-naphthoate octaprenyltransferase
MVFLFFGLMATAGTAYVQAEHVSSAAWWSSVALGFLAVAILVANNLRDIPTDAPAGKRTLAVRLGDPRTRTLYRACVAVSFLTVIAGVAVGLTDEGSGLPTWAVLALGAAVVVVRPVRRIARANGRELIPVLVGTAALQVVFGGLLALGLWIAGVTAS